MKQARVCPRQNVLRFLEKNHSKSSSIATKFCVVFEHILSQLNYKNEMCAIKNKGTFFFVSVRNFLISSGDYENESIEYL